MEVLEISEIRLFDLRAERLFLDPIGYGNELKYGYLASGGGSEKPPHDQAPVFNTYKGLSTSHLSKKRRMNRHHFFDPPNEAEGMPFLLISRVQMLILMGKMVFLALV